MTTDTFRSLSAVEIAGWRCLALGDLAREELFAWLQLAQEELYDANSRDQELEAEALCDALVERLMTSV